MNSFKTDIADICFELSSEKMSRIDALRDGFTPFISSGSKEPNFRVHIKFHKNNKIKHGAFYITHMWKDEYVQIKTSGFSAGIDFSKNRIDVASDPDYGVGGIIKTVLSAILIKEGGFLLHASSVLKKERGASYVFAGPSESGKTTIARLARDLVLTDETTAVKRERGEYRAYSTPFSGEYGNVKENSAGMLKALFFIQKGPSFTHRRLTNGETVRNLFVNAMARTTDPNTANMLFANFSRFAGSVPCHELFVRPVPELWRYIDEHIG